MLRQPLNEVATLAAKFTNSHADKPRATTTPKSAADFQTIFRDIVLEVADAEPEDYSMDAHLRDDLAMDSLDLIEMVMICEKDFRISISDRDWIPVNTVADLWQLVEARLPQLVEETTEAPTEATPAPVADLAPVSVEEATPVSGQA